MNLVFSALGVACAGFCVWLGLRIFNRNERWAKRTAVALVVVAPLFYVLSFGPACWWFAETRNDIPALQSKAAPRLYWPIGWVTKHGPRELSREIRWYATLRRSFVYIPSGPHAGQWELVWRIP